MKILLSLIISLAATLIIELALALLFKVRGKGLWAVVAVNLLTNPPLVLTWSFYPALLIPMELTAVLIEGCCYRLFPKRFSKPFLFSFLFNLSSFLIGGIL